MDVTAALIGGLVGGVLGAIVAGIVGLTTQAREHSFARQQADKARAAEAERDRQARLQERRARTYESMLQQAYRLSLWVERTSPILGPAPEPPKPLPDGKLIELNAATAAHGSAEIRRLTRELAIAARDFNIAVATLNSTTGEKVPAWREVEQARKAFGNAIMALIEQANSELAE